MKKYEVYMVHSLGWREHRIGVHETKEEAEKQKYRVMDGMFDCFVREVETKGE